MTAGLRATEAWGVPPDWVEILAKACDRETQARVAVRIGYSTAVVSHVLANKYTGNLGAVEKAVRGALMALRLECPVMGDIQTNTCISNQRQNFGTANRIAVRLNQTCPTCPHSFQGEKNAQ